MIKYRDSKKFSSEHFKNSLHENLANNSELMVQANQRVFMNKETYKAIMVKSRLRNNFFKGTLMQI